MFKTYMHTNNMHQEYQYSNMANTDVVLHSILTKHFSINLVIYLVIWLFMVVYAPLLVGYPRFDASALIDGELLGMTP